MFTPSSLVDDQFVDMDNLWTLQHGDDSWTVAGKLKCARSFHGSITFRGIVSSNLTRYDILRLFMHKIINNLKLDGTTSFVGEDDFILIGGTKNRSCNGEHISLRADKKSLNVINIDRLTKRSGKQMMTFYCRTFMPTDRPVFNETSDIKFCQHYKMFQLFYQHIKRMKKTKSHPSTIVIVQ